jgi:hypothetical protein
MSCLVALLAIGFPRVALVLVFLFGGYLDRAYETFLWPFLGFLFMPLTTLAYAWAINTGGSVTGFRLAVVVLAVIMDTGLIRAGKRRLKRSSSR